MAQRDINVVKVWDDQSLNIENIEFLRKQTKDVNFPVSDHISQIIQDLLNSYKSFPCAGIAANQLGYDKKIFIGMKIDMKP